MALLSLSLASCADMPSDAVPEALASALLDASLGASPGLSATADAGQHAAIPRTTSPSRANVAALGAKSRAFAFSLYHRYASDASAGNLVFSPYSISTALAMLFAGARDRTEAEMRTALGFDLPQPALHEAFNAVDRDVTHLTRGASGALAVPIVEVINAIWTQHGYPVEPTFLETLARNYGAGVHPVDFVGDSEGARAAINDYVRVGTRDRIKELVPRGGVDHDTRLAVTNSVYFEARWLTGFYERRTQPRTFTRLDGSEVSTSMMSEPLMPCRYAEFPGGQAAWLRYTSARMTLSFVAILPEPGLFAEVERAVSQPWFDALQTQLRQGHVNFELPKLDFRKRRVLTDDLAALGFRSAATGAEFAGISPLRPQLASVLHEATLTVNERGTIATGATFGAVGALSSATPRAIATMKLDRPFLFAIVEEASGQVLFLGRVLDPTAH
ncbi:MAG: serpin family protein [Polyangiales bacterium]